MSDRTENRKPNREPTEAPGARHDAPEEYTSYREVEPENVRPEEAEAVREAELQPGQPTSERRERREEEAEAEEGEEKTPG